MRVLAEHSNTEIYRAIKFRRSEAEDQDILFWTYGQPTHFDY